MDRLLLEDGSGGYELEDGSGVLLPEYAVPLPPVPPTPPPSGRWQRERIPPFDVETDDEEILLMLLAA